MGDHEDYKIMSYCEDYMILFLIEGLKQLKILRHLKL